MSDKPETAKPTPAVAGWSRFPPTQSAVGGILFVPPLSKAKSLPLVVALHGCGQSAGDFAIGTRFADLAAKEDFAVLFPESDRSPDSLTLNPFGCWIWWDAENQGRQGEAALIVGLIDRAKETDERLMAERVFVTGMSAGAAMATILGCVYPDRVRAIAAHAGMAFGAAEAATPAALGSFGQGNAGSSVNYGAFTPFNMLDLMRWGQGARGSIAKAGDDGERDALKALAARGDAIGKVQALIVHGDGDPVVDKANARQLVLQVLQIGDILEIGADDQSVDARADAKRETKASHRGYGYTEWDYYDSTDRLVARVVRVKRLGHAWSGGSPAGTFTDSEGPDATAMTWAFFHEVAATQR